jgi:Zn-dependent M28 family amino/carboxypeptidase
LDGADAPRAQRARSRSLALCVAALLVVSAAASCVAGRGASRFPVDPDVPRAWSVRERVAATGVTAHGILGHVRFLAHDLLEGRAPGSRGGELAAHFIAAQMERMGLLPGATDGTYFQRFDLVGIQSSLAAPVSARAQATAAMRSFKNAKEVVVSSGLQTTGAVTLNDAEVVFVGFGIHAPEEHWDDFKGTDVRGKVLLVLNNEPESDPKRFAGKRRLYYGRWTYKFEEAARRGAAGAIILHTTPSAGYGWNVIESSFGDEEFELPATPGDRRISAKIWMAEGAVRDLVSLGGHELRALLARAERRDFRPMPLGVRISVDLRVGLRKTRTANVLGIVRGSDEALSKEAVVIGAHYDHLGAKPGGTGDRIYNGALDNASGVGGLLSIAEAMQRARPAPKRSVLFAALAAEESGLLGSECFARAPSFEAGRMAAMINIDGLNVWGRTRDVVNVGRGKSTIDDVLAGAAAAQGRVVRGDPHPDRGYFYRSDQFNFARIGVPALYVDPGVGFFGANAATARARMDAYTNDHYHQPSDEVRADWVLHGAVEDLRLLLVTAMRLADAPEMPSWRPGDEFEATRKKALESLRRTKGR